MFTLSSFCMATTTTQQLMSQQTHVRKRASQCLGALSVSLADDLLQKLLQQLLQQVLVVLMHLPYMAQNCGDHM